MSGIPSRTTTRAEGPARRFSARQELIRILGGIGVLALAILLIGWGISAMQWTVLTNDSALPNPVGTGVVFGSYTQTYTMPQGVEQNIFMGIFFGQGGGALVGPEDSQFYGRPAPVSNSTTTIEYYVGFSITNPNGSAVNIWFSSPQGNLTQPCETPQPTPIYVVCTLIPTPTGTGIGPYSEYFQAPVAGNYTLHILPVQCPTDYNYCTSTNATLSVTRAFSTLTYTRPYYNVGLATVIAAGGSIAIAIAYLSIAVNTIITIRRSTRPPSLHGPPPPVSD
jgi:hypothetical protein